MTGAAETRDAEERLLVSSAQHDPRAFAPLYHRYFDSIYRYCYRRLGSPEAAADATSQVFAKALAALPRYRNGSFRSWLFAIAHNTITDAVRTTRFAAPLESIADRADPAQTPEELSVAADDGRTLRAALVHLSADQRRVVELRLAGLTDHEIATVLGRSLAATKMIQVRAVARLRILFGTRESPKEAPDA